MHCQCYECSDKCLVKPNIFNIRQAIGADSAPFIESGYIEFLIKQAKMDNLLYLTVVKRSWSLMSQKKCFLQCYLVYIGYFFYRMT